MPDAKITAVVIDDEQHSVSTLRWKLERYCPEIQLAGEYTDPVKGLEHLKRDPPDLLFLDVEMPRLNGFELLEELGDQIAFEVIFTTAYDEFGIRAIKFSALDYLLKPIQNAELKEAVEKYRRKGGSGMNATQLEVLFSNIREEIKGRPMRIALATKESIEFVEPSAIIVCTSDSNYTQVFLADGRRKLLSRTLKEFEELLTGFNFFRTHHSHLVNLRHIKEYVRTDGGYLIMSNKMNIPVARSKKEELLNLF